MADPSSPSGPKNASTPAPPGTSTVPAEEELSERRDERVTINKEFESYDAFIHEYVTNISRSGVFIRSKSPLPVGTKVNLHFTVIMDDIEAVEGVGEVVRVHEDPPGMGVVFTELSGYSKGLIDKLLTSQGRKAAEGQEKGPPSDGPRLETEGNPKGT
ncbi:MAG: PilZ domain-containing protein [Polyangiaceae bacterium]|nr:PilZ domain-containing protein [Polyangiaceae bacterium]